MNHFDSNPPEPAAALLEDAQNIIGRSMRGVYLFGSAADGGLQKESDIDLLIVNDGDLNDDQREQLLNACMEISGAIGNDAGKRYLEVTVVNSEALSSWQHPPQHDFLYGEWLRADYEKGRIPKKETNPDLTLVLKQLQQHHRLMSGERFSDIMEDVPLEDVLQAIADTLAETIRNYKGDERNTILTLTRMMMTVRTGRILSKDESAMAVAPEIPEKPRHLIETAVLGYLGKYDDSKSYEKSDELLPLIAYMEKRILKGMSHQ